MTPDEFARNKRAHDLYRAMVRLGNAAKCLAAARTPWAFTFWQSRTLLLTKSMQRLNNVAQ